MRTPTIITLLSLAATSSLLARPPQDQAPGPGPAGNPERLLERFDADGNGQLNQQELAAAMQARRTMRQRLREHRLEKFDTDGDGRLSAEERRNAREMMQAKHREIIAKYDADNDGRLSREERRAAIDAGEALPPRPLRPGRGNGDGARNGNGPNGKGARNRRGGSGNGARNGGDTQGQGGRNRGGRRGGGRGR